MPPMLPAAGENKDDFSHGRTGQWDKRPWSDLEAIANRTPNTTDNRSKIDVDLIPDVWARQILFANALYDDKHLLHGQSLKAFRGFLALLALRTRKSILIKTEELRLDKTGAWPFAAAARSLADGVQHGMHQIYSDTGWDEIYLFRGDGGSLLGVTSPLSLICPAQGPATTGLSQLSSSWFNGDQFLDPSAGDVLNSDDRDLLGAWLNQLRSNLAEHARNNVSWQSGHEKLLGTIRKFAEALTQNTGAAGPYAEGSLRLGSSAYSYLAGALQQEEVDLEESHIVLDSSVKPPVLLPFRLGDDPINKMTYAMEPPADAAKITVVSGTSLKDIDTAVWGNNPHTLAGRALPHEAEWIDPRTFFLDRLYLLKGTQQSSGMNHAKGQRDVANELSAYPVMPFAQRLTELLPADRIVKNVRFSIENEGGDKAIVVKLRLPLKGGKVLEVTKAYPGDKQSDLAKIPVLEVWPPFRKTGWRLYSTFWWSEDEDAFGAEPFPIEKDGLQDETEIIGRSRIRVMRLGNLPEGFFLQVPHPQRGRGIMQQAGIIFNNFAEITTPPKGTWAAGVDFGTSSTNIVLRDGKNGEYPLRLGQSGPLRVVAGKDGDRAPALYQYFLPFTPENEQAAQTSPFLSFLRMRDPKRTSFESISGAHVLFYSPSHNVQELSAGRLATNLKWEGESKSRSRPYLQQICLQTAAEAAIGGAQKLEWSYSYPAAFSMHKELDYASEWEEICTFVSEQTGLGSDQPHRMVESLATARYFKEREEAPPEVGAIFLDIGGGTTDISIWQGTSSKCEISIRCAGRDLFLAPLFQVRKQIIPEFKTAGVSKETVDLLIANQSESEFFARAEAMLREAGSKLPADLQHLGKLETPALPLRFGVAGLFYYIGTIVQHLEKANQYKRSLGGVFIGGNGGQLLLWADGGKYNPAGALASLLTGSLFAGAGWTDNAPKNMRIKLSQKPKQEAATGLVVQSSMDSGEHWSDVIAGEPFTLRGQQKAETDRITREELRDSEVTGLPRLSAFYDNYVRLADKIGYPRARLDKDDLFARAEERVRQHMADQRDVAEEDLDGTPPFIKALQMLVIGIARANAERVSGASSGR